MFGVVVEPIMAVWLRFALFVFKSSSSNISKSVISEEVRDWPGLIPIPKPTVTWFKEEELDTSEQLSSPTPTGVKDNAPELDNRNIGSLAPFNADKRLIVISTGPGRDKRQPVFRNYCHQISCFNKYKETVNFIKTVCFLNLSFN